MITLKTLPQATAQQVFDQVATHLLTQNAKSINNTQKDSDGSADFCMYRAPNGLKCAAGCLIGDDEYTPRMENKMFGGVIRMWADAEFELTSLLLAAYKVDLVVDLQAVHDGAALHNWRLRLAHVAKRHALDPAVLA